MMSARNQEIVLAREDGQSLLQLGERYGVSHQRVAAVVRSARELVDQVELDLMVARKDGEICIYLVPYGPDYQMSLAFCDWIVGQLRKRDVEVLALQCRRASNGIAMLLSDVTDYSGGNHECHRTAVDPWAAEVDPRRGRGSQAAGREGPRGGEAGA